MFGGGTGQAPRRSAGRAAARPRSKLRARAGFGDGDGRDAVEWRRGSGAFSATAGGYSTRKYFQIVNCDCDIVNYDSYIVKLDYATPGSEIVNFDYATPGSEIVNFDYATPGSEIVNFLTISDPGVA